MGNYQVGVSAVRGLWTAAPVCWGLVSHHSWEVNSDVDISSGGYHDSYQDISSPQDTGAFSGFGGEASSKSNDGWDDWNDSGWSQESPARR